jgi:hypothetical protein
MTNFKSNDMTKVQFLAMIIWMYTANVKFGVGHICVGDRVFFFDSLQDWEDLYQLAKGQNVLK